MNVGRKWGFVSLLAVVGLLAIVFSTRALSHDLAKELQLPAGNLEVEAAKAVAEFQDPQSLAKELVRQRLELQATEINSALAVHAAAFHTDAWAKIDAIWTNKTIPVSWENATSKNIKERKWIRAAVENSWEKECAVRFVGWGNTPLPTGIRILISDNRPHVKRLGRFLDGIPNGMELNIHFKSWCSQCGLDRRGSIEKTAVHEFGHALGFAHEQNRPDAPDRCRDERQGENGDWRVTIYDPSSVMNYCNPNWDNGGKLSPCDIYAARTLYGDPPNQAGAASLSGSPSNAVPTPMATAPPQ